MSLGVLLGMAATTFGPQLAHASHLRFTAPAPGHGGEHGHQGEKVHLPASQAGLTPGHSDAS
jgi:hypothetical protein